MFKGYAALLDVMGFSSMVASENHSRRIEDYLSALNDNPDLRDKNIEYVVFSDSIVVTTANDTDDSLQMIAKACSSVFGAFLKLEIPVRGAITHGSYIRQKTDSGTFVAGRAIVDAYQFEKIQNWCGIMLCPSIVEKVSDLSDRCRLYKVVRTEREAVQRQIDLAPWSAFIQPCDSIPFHGEPSTLYSGFAIPPTNGQVDPRQVRDSLKSGLKSLERLKSIAPDPKAQMKYTAACNWLSELHSRWHHLVMACDQHGL
jgi:hypothetical protein